MEENKVFLEVLEITSLIEYENNPREHSKEQVKLIAKSIQEFTQYNPIIIDEDNVIIAGHGRLEALKHLKMKTAECRRLEGLTDEQKVAVRILDNKSALNATWSNEVLAIELEKLTSIDFDLSLTGFDDEELEGILDIDIDNKEIAEDDFDVEEALNKEEAITKRGDIWQLGRHRLLCGDSTSEEDIKKLIQDKTIDSLITDPPYGVDYSSKNEFLNKYKKGNCIQKEIKNDNIEDYRKFFSDFLKVIPFSEYNTFYIAMSGQELHNVRLAIEDNNMKWFEYLVWVKNNHVLCRKDYSAKHEFFVYGCKGKHKFHGDFSTTVLEYNKLLKNDLHPTMKPIELIARLINDGSPKGGNIYDAFGGSGTTLIACEQTNRTCFMMELDEKYCDVIVKRWEDYTGEKAILINGKET